MSFLELEMKRKLIPFHSFTVSSLDVETNIFSVGEKPIGFGKAFNY